MSSGKSEYDRSVTTYSPQGRLFQIEYAIESIKMGTTAIGMRTAEGVLLVVEKKLANVLIVPQTLEKMFEIDNHIACATAGLLADARTLVDHARNEAQNHWFTYNEPMGIESCINAISDLALDFADITDGRRKKVMSRPFGVALLLGGVENGKPQLWMTDPSGTCTEYQCAAIGSAQEGATQMLSEQYKPDISFAEAEVACLQILKETMEAKMTNVNVEVACVKKDAKYHLYSPEEVQNIIQRLPTTVEYAQS